ncbi:hypothetical protein ACOVUO_004857 [Escherichia coli]|uniref:Uncharacterized protein n=1 Tax=Escherichia coli TaxID=562 RepID=A0A6L6ZQI2_ECOLX|nr:hypothetical protein [Escherichia coli]EES4172092.1 hypothetical protein [Escherichia coli]EJG7545356.1 hypothetical protein [Escherichia coli]EMA2753885.1 hypothetical protein [Escherichia coli]MBB7083851.1 hypothetical protein [Escherichia coli]MED9213645.1 hypothetical protein [Escherichia coli]
MHTNDRSLTMVDLFCCAGATARLVSEAGSEELSRVIASGREGKRKLTAVCSH